MCNFGGWEEWDEYDLVFKGWPMDHPTGRTGLYLRVWSKLFAELRTAPRELDATKVHEQIVNVFSQWTTQKKISESLLSFLDKGGEDRRKELLDPENPLIAWLAWGGKALKTAEKELERAKEDAAAVLETTKKDAATELKRVIDKAASDLKAANDSAAKFEEQWELIRDKDLLAALPTLTEPKALDYSGYGGDFTVRPGPETDSKPNASGTTLDSGDLRSEVIQGLKQGLTIEAWIACSMVVEPLDLITVHLADFQVSLGIEDLGKGKISLRSSDSKSTDYLFKPEFTEAGTSAPWIFVLEPPDNPTEGQKGAWHPHFFGTPGGKLDELNVLSDWGEQPVTQPIELPASIESLRIQIAVPGPSSGDFEITRVRVYRRALSRREIKRSMSS